MSGPGFAPNIFQTRQGYIPLSLLDADIAYVSKKVVSVNDWGAIGDGVTDDTASINAAIAAVNAISASVPVSLSFQNGLTYNITSTPSSFSRGNLAIVGDGAILNITGGGAGSVIGLTFNTGAPTTNYLVRGLTVTSASQGAIGIKFGFCGEIKMQNVTIYNQAIGLDLAVYEYALIGQCVFNLCPGGIRAEIGDGLFVTGCYLNAKASGSFLAGSKGIQLKNCAGNYIVSTDLTRFENGIDIQPAGGAAVTWTFLTEVSCDTSSIGLFATTAGGGLIKGIQATNCWFSSSTAGTGYGMQLVGVVGSVFDACTIYNNNSWGAVIQNCVMWRISNSLVGWNNRSGSAATGGIFVQGCTQAFINDNDITNLAAGWGPVYSQKVGILIAGAQQNDIHIIDNHFADHDYAGGNLDIDWATAPSSLGTVRGNTTNKTNGVADAATITPDLVFDTVHITGTGTAITNITTTQIPDKQLTIITDGAVTINNAGNFKLAGAANFAGTAGSYLTLVVNPTNSRWSERARSIM
jgi:polygalacturonase